MGDHDACEGIQGADRRLAESEQAHQRVVHDPAPPEEKDEGKGHDSGRDAKGNAGKGKKEPAPAKVAPGDEPRAGKTNRKGKEGGESSLDDGKAQGTKNAAVKRWSACRRGNAGHEGAREPDDGRNDEGRKNGKKGDKPKGRDSRLERGESARPAASPPIGQGDR
jgi:hypothetical protein